MIDRLQQFFHRVTSVFRRKKLDRDLDAELAATWNWPPKKICSAAYPLRKPVVRH